MKSTLNSDTSALSRIMSKQLGIPLSAPDGHFPKQNPSYHKSVSEDCSPDTIAMFNRLMEDDHRLLVEELAKASLEGASLVGYNGSLGNKSETNAWLLSGM